MNNRTAVLAAVLALTAGFGAWRLHIDQPPVSGQSAGPASSGPTASGPVQPAAPGAEAPFPAPAPGVEVAEPSENETLMDKMGPRQSVARAAGLHKVPDSLNLASSAAIVLDTRSKQPLYAKNDQAVLPMASITKLMTALIVAETKMPLDEVITISEGDVDTERHSRSRLRVGTTLTRGDALHLALMSSENRAAHALARTSPQGLEKFIAQMNAKAQQLGMKQTRYVDPTGLSAENRSTARDIATLVMSASQFPLLREYSTTPQMITPVGTRTLQYLNSNRLIREGRWDIDLQKTGFINEAGWCVAMLTEVAGKEVAMVLLDAGNKGERAHDAERLRVFLGGEPLRKPVVAQAKPAAAEESKPTAPVAQRKAVAEKKPVAEKKAIAAARPGAARKTERTARGDSKMAARKASTDKPSKVVAETKPNGRKSVTFSSGNRVASRKDDDKS